MNATFNDDTPSASSLSSSKIDGGGTLLLLTNLPTVFLGTAGLLLHVFYQQHGRSSIPVMKHRIQATVTLWLAAALTMTSDADSPVEQQNNQNMTLVYLHGIFLSALATAIVSQPNKADARENNPIRQEESQARYSSPMDRTSQQQHQGTYYTIAYHHHHQSTTNVLQTLQIVLDSLVLSFWTGLLVQSLVSSFGILPSLGSWHVSLMICCITFILVAWRKCVIATTRETGGASSNSNDNRSMGYRNDGSDCHNSIDAICPHWPCQRVSRASSDFDATTTTSRNALSPAQQQSQYGHSSSLRSSVMDMDESHWHEWSPEESMIWILDALHDDPPLQNIVARLGPENLTLRQLVELESLADLRHVTGIPYGQLLFLRQCILEKLQSLYPIDVPNHSEPPRQAAARQHPPLGLTKRQQGSWLAQHDHEYNSRGLGGADHGHLPEQTIKHPLSSAGLATHQQASSIMEERFGLELPTMKTNESQQQQQQQHVSGPPSLSANNHHNTSTSNTAPPQESRGGVDNNSNIWGALPPEFLANMPPHISEIVKRKPHLVEQILKQHRETMAKRPKEPPLNIRPPMDAATAAGGFDFASLVVPGGHDNDNVEERRGLLTAVDETGEPLDDEQSDGETTELLLRHRRRRGNHNDNLSGASDHLHHGAIGNDHQSSLP